VGVVPPAAISALWSSSRRCHDKAHAPPAFSSVVLFICDNSPRLSFFYPSMTVSLSLSLLLIHFGSACFSLPSSLDRCKSAPEAVTIAGLLVPLYPCLSVLPLLTSFCLSVRNETSARLNLVPARAGSNHPSGGCSSPAQKRERIKKTCSGHNDAGPTPQ
jgi:hypothetical protein